MSNQVLSEQTSLELAAWVRLLRGYAGLTGDLSARLQEEQGLTINDYEVLLLLSHAEGDRMRRVDLAREVKLSPSGITRLLGGLERQGYVERAASEDDARVTFAVLTERGRTKLEEASGPHIEAIRSAMAQRFSEAELETLNQLLSRLPGAGGETDPRCCEAGA